jgi:hypothetical protein
MPGFIGVAPRFIKGVYDRRQALKIAGLEWRTTICGQSFLMRHGGPA